MIDFGKRLKSLKERRQGSRERAIFESTTMDNVSKNRAIILGQDLRIREQYEALNESDSVKYTIGAMAPVDDKSTEVSISEGQRVADSLIKSLKVRGINTISQLQGSVALDIHIKGHSDVDMLIIKENVIQVEDPRVIPNYYTDSGDIRTMENIVKEIRLESEDILPRNFPQVTVDCTGNKSIAMSEGSLQRKVDVVPASWFDTIAYQKSKNENDRGIKIYHKGDHELILNLPFKHIQLISNKDSIYNGNLRRVIRLMKNMIADMPNYKKIIAKKLSSYDLAAIAYHMNTDLYLSYEMRLGLVEKTRGHLQKLLTNSLLRMMLDVPDGSRRIFDTSEKARALEVLTSEFAALSESIFKDLKPFVSTYDSSVILNKRVA